MTNKHIMIFQTAVRKYVGIYVLYDSNSLRRKKRPLIGLGQCAWALNRYRSETLKSPGHFLRLTTISIFKLNYFQYFLKFYLLENE